MKLKCLLVSAILLKLTTSLNAQCNDINGIAGFEISNLNSNYFNASGGKGTIELTTEEAYTGNKSLKVEAFEDNFWEVRVVNNTASCEFAVTENEINIISFYAKGDIGTEINISLLDGSDDIGSKKITISSTNWKQYIVPITATATISDATYRMQFKKQGIYYVDDFQINMYDCNGDFAGTAAIDACEICSGGSTGIPVNLTCDLIDLASNHPNLRFDGVLETEMNGDTTIFYRFKKSYSTNNASQATSGVQVVLRTASPLVRAHFFIDRDRTSGTTFWSGFGIFRDGVLVDEVRNRSLDPAYVEFPMENLTGGVVEWVITLPAGSAAELIKFEILDGYSLEPVPANDKSVYVAIGNSITQGVGTVYFHSNHTWPWIVADSLNYQLHNFAIGGSSVTDEVLTNFDGTITPDLISVLWGYNDVHYNEGWNANVLEDKTFPKYRALLEGLLTRFPDACIMALLQTHTTNMEHGTHSATRTIEILRTRQLEIIEDLKLTYSNLEYFDGEPSTNFPEALNPPDPVHLTIAGNRALAEAFINEDPCLITGAEDVEIVEHLTAFPNPTSGIVKWDNETLVEITNVEGKRIFQGQANSFDFSNQATGIYFIKAGNKFAKIVKK